MFQRLPGVSARLTAVPCLTPEWTAASNLDAHKMSDAKHGRGDGVTTDLWRQIVVVVSFLWV